MINCNDEIVLADRTTFNLRYIALSMQQDLDNKDVEAITAMNEVFNLEMYRGVLAFIPITAEQKQIIFDDTNV